MDAIIEFIKWILSEYGLGVSGYLFAAWFFYRWDQESKLNREVIINNTKAITEMRVIFEERSRRM